MSYVVVEFLTESLGEDRVRVRGPYDDQETAEQDATWTRATRAMKVVPLDPVAEPEEGNDG